MSLDARIRLLVVSLFALVFRLNVVADADGHSVGEPTNQCSSYPVDKNNNRYCLHEDASRLVNLSIERPTFELSHVRHAHKVSPVGVARALAARRLSAFPRDLSALAPMADDDITSRTVFNSISLVCMNVFGGCRRKKRRAIFEIEQS